MGIDLNMLPFDCDQDNFAYSHTILNCERRRDLFGEISKLPSSSVPAKFTSYLSRDKKFEESHYGETTTTPYGEQLTFIEAGSLIKFKNHVDVNDNSKNRAIWAYLAALPANTKVALYWH